VFPAAREKLLETMQSIRELPDGVKFMKNRRNLDSKQNLLSKPLTLEQLNIRSPRKKFASALLGFLTSNHTGA
jgi:hypothetical protein